jgi:hypothetical protein
MAAERLIGTSGLNQMTQTDAIASQGRMLGWNWKTSGTGKKVTGIYIRMHESGSFVSGTRVLLFKRASPISTSTLIQNIDVSSLTGSSGAEIAVPGVAQTALVQNDFYFVALYHPSTQTGNYWFKVGFGNPANGSLSGNCIFKNGSTATDPPDDETFTDGGFGIDVEINDDIVSAEIGQVTETGTPFSIVRRKIYTLNFLSESGTAFPPTYGKSKSIGQAVENGTVFPVTDAGIISREIGQVIEVGAVGSIGEPPEPDTTINFQVGRTVIDLT